MKKSIFTLLLFLIAIVTFGQNSNSGPLKFLGIPIDGTKTKFVSKLKSKGFTYNSLLKNYEGQFNGKTVDVYIHTNHNIVDRVYVAFPCTTKEDVRVDFNKLLNQLKDNRKYRSFWVNNEIPEDEDISYEISVNNKRYQAIFSYFDEDRDKLELTDNLINDMSDCFTKEDRNIIKENLKFLITASEEEKDGITNQLISETQLIKTGDTEKAFNLWVQALGAIMSLVDGEVWFMIHEFDGKYYIGLYYDNLHNRAHGEDL